MGVMQQLRCPAATSPPCASGVAPRANLLRPSWPRCAAGAAAPGASAPEQAPAPPAPQPATAVQKLVTFPYNNIDQGKLDGCRTGQVVVDNKSHPSYTVVTVELEDYPGLVRVMSWVLNGMSMRVHHGVLNTKDGVVTDKLWLTDYRNKKLKDSSAASLAERLEEFMLYCAPQQDGHLQRQEWNCGIFEVSNAAHPEFTQVIIKGEPSSHKPGFLLELASALASVGASIKHAVIQGSAADAPVNVAEPGYEFSRGRFFQFLLSDSRGGKLDEDRISSLVYTLGLIAGRGTMPTVAPNVEAILSRIGDLGAAK